MSIFYWQHSFFMGLIIAPTNWEKNQNLSYSVVETPGECVNPTNSFQIIVTK